MKNFDLHNVLTNIVLYDTMYRKALQEQLKLECICHDFKRNNNPGDIRHINLREALSDQRYLVIKYGNKGIMAEAKYAKWRFNWYERL